MCVLGGGEVRDSGMLSRVACVHNSGEGRDLLMTLMMPTSANVSPVLSAFIYWSEGNGLLFLPAASPADCTAQVECPPSHSALLCRPAHDQVATLLGEVQPISQDARLCQEVCKGNLQGAKVQRQVPAGCRKGGSTSRCISIRTSR
jgi:hypothetical protein